MDKLPSGSQAKRAYIQYNRHNRIANFKVGCVLVVFLMPAGLVLDCFVYPQKVDLFFEMRLLCSLLAMILWALLKTSLGERHFITLGMLCFVLPSFFISMMIYVSDGVASSYYAGLNLVLIGMTWAAQVDFAESVIASLLSLVMYGTACLANGTVSYPKLFNNFYFICLTGIIVVTGSYYFNRLRFREFTLRAELDASRKDLERSNLKLVEMDKAKSEFFANISHELRTPLTLLIGPLERLKSDSAQMIESQRVELMEIMYGNALRLLRLINDLLSLVRLDSGSLTLRKEKVQLRSFIEGLAQSVFPMAQQCHLEFTTRLALGEEKTGWMDRDKVEKIVYNLLFNAFKFTPQKGRVTLTAELSDQILEIKVIDTGMGIAPDDLEKVFDRFWQVERSTTRRYQGAGIGLALVQELAFAHGGKASATSVLGKGTTMQVTLNLAPPEPAKTPEVVSQVPTHEENALWLTQLYRRAELFPAHVVAGSSFPKNAKPLKLDRPKVLVVDDEPDMRRFLQSQLEESYQVEEACNGQAALTMLEKGDFSLVLLDYMMPDLDGLEVMRRLRQKATTSSIPIVVLTARADEDFKIRTLQAGATDFLTKPFSSTELIVRAKNIIATQQLQKQLEKKNSELHDALEQIKATESQLVHQAKMASLGQLSAGLMHEINNPLNFANTAFHLLKKRLSGPAPCDDRSLAKPLADIQDGIKRVIDITSSLRTFTHPDTASFSHVDLHEALSSSIRFVQIDPRQVSLHVDVPPTATIYGNSNQLIHLFINLLQNSVDSLMEKNGETKEIRITAIGRPKEIEIVFFDSGKGISRQNLSQIYDAFFTTKKVGSGVGLGLNICHRIVGQHQGRITVESKEGEFCEFRLVFPTEKP